MKKILNISVLIIFPLLIGLLLLIYVIIPQKNPYPGYQTMTYRLVNKNYRLLIADNQDKWTKGLMYYRQLKGVDGMIFLFPDKAYRTFWNKNTLMNLDLVWLDDNAIKGKDRLPSIEKSQQIVMVSSPAPVNKVIELPAN